MLSCARRGYVFAAALFGLVGLGSGALGQTGSARGIGSSRAANPMGLLLRPEVQTEIVLDLRQRNALNALVQGMADQRQQAMQSLAQLRGLSRQERQQRMEQIRAQMQLQNAGWQGELDEGVKAILRPAQITRLHQLDLQKRGILALADPRVADEVKLAADRRQAIAQAVSQADATRQQATAEAYQAWRQAGGAPNAAPDVSSPLSPLRRKLDAADRQAQDDVTSMLSAEELGRWRAALGRRFVFRADDRQSAGPPRF